MVAGGPSGGRNKPSRGVVTALESVMENKQSLKERMEQAKQKAAAAEGSRFIKNQQNRQQRAQEKADRLKEGLRELGE